MYLYVEEFVNSIKVEKRNVSEIHSYLIIYYICIIDLIDSFEYIIRDSTDLDA